MTSSDKKKPTRVFDPGLIERMVVAILRCGSDAPVGVDALRRVVTECSGLTDLGERQDLILAVLAKVCEQGFAIVGIEIDGQFIASKNPARHDITSVETVFSFDEKRHFDRLFVLQITPAGHQHCESLN